MPIFNPTGGLPGGTNTQVQYNNSGIFGGSSGMTLNATQVTGITLSSPLSVLNGGNAQSSYTDGQLLIGNTVGNTLTKATLTAGSNITITNGNGSITIAATGGTPAGTGSELQYRSTGTTFGAVSGSSITTRGDVTLAPSAATSGSPTHLTLTGAAHTTLAASTEDTDINFNLARTVQFSTGALTTQRAVRIQAPTYGFVAASTITNAITLDISGAPIAGTNATITNAYGLRVNAGQATAVPLVVQAAASQTAHLQEWQKSDGTIFAAATADTDATNFSGLSVAAASSIGFVLNGSSPSMQSAASGIGVTVGGVSTSHVFGNGFIGTRRDRGGVYAWSPGSMTGVSSLDTGIESTVGVVLLTDGQGNGTVKTALRVGQPTTSTVALSVKAVASATADLQEWQNSAGTNLDLINANGDLTIQSAARTSGSPTLFTLTGPAHTTLTASTEATDVNFNLARTVQFATGALTTQRAVRVQAPTYGFVAASTITTAVTFEIGGAPVAGTNATITTPLAFRVNSGNSAFGALISNYNGVATTGWGVPAIYGTGRSTGQSGAVASVAAYTVGAADGSFLVSSNVNITAGTTFNFQVQVAYTDETNTAQTLNLNLSVLGGTLSTSIVNTSGNGPYQGVPVQIRCKASTSITIKTSGTFTTVTYNVEGSIIQIS